MTQRTRGRAADAIVVGGGVIGLSVAIELSRRGATCMLIADDQPGTASVAAAGLLAPSVGDLTSAARPFFFESLARFPAYLASLDDGAAVGAWRGLIAIPSASNESAPPGAREITAPALASLEPALRGHPRAFLFENDGAVDNVALVAALTRTMRASDRIDVHQAAVTSIELHRDCVRVVTMAGDAHHGTRVVIAAGAWSPHIRGLPRPLPVYPLKGQMLALDQSPLERAVMGEDVYLVPRVGETVVGATAERAGFDLTVHADAIETLRRAAVRVCPALAQARVARSWAGIRPATPDLLPIIGPDPADSRVLYACGHSKNGILLAPATAVAMADLVEGRKPSADLRPFALERFGSASSVS